MSLFEGLSVVWMWKLEPGPSLLASETRDVMKMKTVLEIVRPQSWVWHKTHAGGGRYSIDSYLKSRTSKEPGESPKRP